MADTIRQDFIINATSAVNTLDRVDQAFQAFEKRLGTTSKAIQNFNNLTRSNRDGVQGLSRSIGSLGRNLERFSKATPSLQLAQGFTNAEQAALLASAAANKLGTSTQRAASQTQKLVVSWGTLVRVVTTQAIVRALNAVRNLIGESVTQAIDLQKQFALITTIQPGANLGQISEAVRGISDNLNINQLEIAQGLYNAISNQVSGLFSETVRFTEAAGEFARATGSTLADSVDLLSGAIRSYGLTVDDVDRVQGIFFDAIDKGRVTADELSNTFGRVGPSAAALGISLEEVAGAVAAISDRGLGTAETLTAVRGIITALTKPSDELKKVLLDLGFSSGESAIQTLGFADTLAALTEAVGGSIDGLAQLFPRVRGLTGVLAGANDNFETLRDNIESATRAGREFEGRQFAQATATDAEALTQTIQQVRNEFLQLGQDFLQVSGSIVRSLTQLTEGTNLLGSSFDALRALAGPIITGTIVAGIVALTAAVGPLAPAIIAVSVALAGVAVATAELRRKAVQDINQVSNALQELQEQEIEATKQANQEQLDSIRDRNAQIVRDASRVVQANAGFLNEQLQFTQQFNDQVVADSERAIDRIVGARKAIVSELRNTIQDTDDEIRGSAQRILSLQDQLATRRFERTIVDQGPAEQVFALTKRAQEQAAEAARLVQQGTRQGNEQLVSRGQRLFTEAQKLADRAEQTADSDAGLRRRAQLVGDDIIQRAVKAEEQRGNLLKTQKTEAERLLPAEEKRLQIVTAIGEQLKQNLDLLATGGGEEAITRQLTTLQQGLQRLRVEAGDLSALDRVGLGSLEGDVRDALTTGLQGIGATIAVNEAAVLDQAERTRQIIQERLQFTIELGDAARTAAFEGNLNAVNRGLDESRDNANTLAQELFKSEESAQQFGAAIQLANTALAGIGENVPERLQQARDILAQILEDGRITKEELQAASESINNITPTALEGFNPFAEFNTNEAKAGTEQLVLAATSIKDAFNLIQTSDVFSAEDQQNLNNASNTLLNVGAQVSTDIQSGTDAAGRSLVTAAIQAREILSNAAPTNNIPGQQFGGFFQDGGQVSRGKDSLLAAVSPGEVITDARNARRFMPQLQAIGAGRAPVFRSEGSVTTVGDVNVSVQGGQSSSATAREIGNELRRLIKRGQLRL